MIDNSDITLINTEDIRTKSTFFKETITDLAKRVDVVYVHIDLDVLARSFDLTGGSIRNACMTAAYAAADAVESVGQKQLLEATERECRKLGKLGVLQE